MIRSSPDRPVCGAAQAGRWRSSWTDAGSHSTCCLPRAAGRSPDASQPDGRDALTALLGTVAAWMMPGLLAVVLAKLYTATATTRAPHTADAPHFRSRCGRGEPRRDPRRAAGADQCRSPDLALQGEVPGSRSLHRAVGGDRSRPAPGRCGAAATDLEKKRTR